ncbi:uncharacterized protein LOC118750785 [Rhagoletis pomonella]|uniref:uncharacterized protein LOC118750785 n=1 Tax=Rhagoletis pomonella TaxID=28610 RepID=UPI001782103E|nr:uncharacterized protein LOC118750785 [Rhagoletis pomonella]
MSIIKKRDIWSDREVQQMLSIIRENHILKLMDSKAKRNRSIFEDVAAEMAAKGIQRSSTQIRTKFKALKLDYYKVKRNNNKSGAKRQTSEHFTLLDEILGHRPAVTSTGLDTSLAEFLSDEDTQPEMQGGENVAPNVLEDTDGATKPFGRTFKRTKKLSYQKAVENFSKEWKTSQNDLLDYMKTQDETFLYKQEEILKMNREETQKIMEKDREETNKMLSAFLEAMKAPQPIMPVYCQPSQSTNPSQPSTFFFSPFKPKNNNRDVE